MCFRHAVRAAVMPSTLLILFFIGLSSVSGLQKAATASRSGELTVERIFSEPSLNGRVYRGVLWPPNDHHLIFLDTKGFGRNEKTDLGVMDSARGVRSMWSS